MDRGPRLIIVGIGLMTLAAAAAEPTTRYDAVTSAQVQSARRQVERGSFADGLQSNFGASVDVYTTEQLGYMVEHGLLESVVRGQDRCQFVPDIEDRARLVGLPVFQFVWGDLLLSGVCVKQDQTLAIEYIKKAADNSYPAAMERMAFYYEKGYFVPQNLQQAERYMYTAAALGSLDGKLGWADMLVRGYGAPQLYEEAFSWLYHTAYADPYRQQKKDFLARELARHLPPEVQARDKQFTFDL